MKNDRKGIQIDNSFTFQFTNTTNSAQTITLFREGTNDTNDVKETFSSGQTNALNYTYPTLPLFLWNFEISQPFYYFGNPILGNLTSYPTSINDISIRGTGNIDLISDNEIAPTIYSTISVPVTDGENLGVVNARINQYIRDFADTTNFRNANGDVMVFNFTIDFSIFQQYPLPILIAGFNAPFGVSIQYPDPDLPIGSTLNSIRLQNIITPSSVLATFQDIDLIHPLTSIPSANGVVVRDIGNVSYNEIKESQNGGILDIESLVINIANSPSLFQSQSQLLQPLKFKKINVNGNEEEVVVNQVIDPYQYQNSFSSIQLTNDGEIYVLDGNTKFEYVIEPQTSVNLTYNYVGVKNIDFGTDEQNDKIIEQQNTIAELDNTSDSSRIKILDISTYKSGTNNSTKNNLPLLIGIIAIIILLNLNTNQK